MRFLASAHSSLLSRTRYVKRGCRCDRQIYRILLNHEREFKYQSNVMIMPLTSTLPCLRVTGSSCSGAFSERQRVNSNVVGRTIYQFPISSLCCMSSRIPALVFVRHLHVGSPRFDKEPLKPSSKVEQTVEVLKKDLLVSEKPAVSPAVKKTLWQKIKDECLHYYHGFRLLFVDINVSRKLLWRVMNGKSLSRREYRLLVRTVSDMFRLVPFSVFVIVPFMEFLLPFAIKFFPGMLPSTFETATDKEAKLKRSLKVNLEVAKFLQETLDEMAVKAKGHSSDTTKQFTEFFTKLRSSGQQATTEEILKFSKLFEDEITLDSLQRPQLVALCRLLELHTLGTNNFLRFQLRMKLRSLAADDKMIQKEGVDSLTPQELQQANKARGMRAYGISEARLKSQLAQWLDLSLTEKVPPSLLLLSRALLEMPETVPASDQLKATISVLPETLVTQTKAAIEEREGKIDNRTKIDVIKEEVRLIKEERQEMREEEKRHEKEEVLIDHAPTLVDKAPEIVAERPAGDKKELTSTDLETLEDALDEVSKDRKKLLMEREELLELKEELAEYQEDVADLKEVLKVAGDSKVDVQETKGAQRLFKKVSSMIQKMDTVVAQLEKEEQLLKQDLAMGDTETKKKCEELVSIEELIKAIKLIQKVPDESLVERLSEVLSKIDLDRDGAIRVDDLRKIIEVVGKEKVKLSQKQLDEIVELMTKEEMIELEEQIGKVLEKESLQSVREKKGPKSPGEKASGAPAGKEAETESSQDNIKKESKK
ncbi:hypothetical protein R5R35_005703 [Gryllus longicercus]|uniref:Mitochondrial proton/calcium exchanger protein n=1 Tax=Gryllus longicercus TaxID=2509291 RepID=A0AAN9ZHB3_9ORTH